MENVSEIEETTIDYAELYRQNYEDALDEIRNLKLEINDLKQENECLREMASNKWERRFLFD